LSIAFLPFSLLKKQKDSETAFNFDFLLLFLSHLTRIEANFLDSQ
jgi:hypothetical protein